MPRTALPPISPAPADKIWRWKHRYWDIGQTVHCQNGRSHTITRIAVNKFGRVSYWSENQQLLLEELVPTGHISTP